MKKDRFGFLLGILSMVFIVSCSGGPGESPSAPSADTGTPSTEAKSAAGLWLTGYYPSYQQFTMAPSELNYSSLTHLIHWPVLPKPDGNLDTASMDFSEAHSKDVVSRAHAAGIKVLLGIGGDSASGATAGFQGATKAENRTRFINNIVSLMQARGYDGVDINWEEITAADDAAFLALIRELRQALDTVNPRPLLTMPPTTGSDARPQLVAQVQQQFDQINLQTYVMSGPYPGWVTWFNSPLANGGLVFPGEATQVPYAENEIKRFADAGIPLKKMGLGVQFGGFVWAGGSGTDTGGVTKPRQSWDKSKQRADGNDIGAPSVSLVSYTEILDKLTTAQGFQKIFDPTARVPFLSRDNQNNADDRFVSFDDEQAIQEKAEFIRKRGMGGMFIFELSGDYFPNQVGTGRHPLLLSASQSVLGGATPP